VVLCAAGLVPAASASAKKMDRATAFRYALTTSLPSKSAVTPSTPISSVEVSSCKRRSARAFTCGVTVHYEEPPPSDPNVRTGAPQCEYDVRVEYRTARSTKPRARRVGVVRCVA